MSVEPRRKNFSKQPGEQIPIGFNFTNDLASAETIASIVTEAIDLADASDVKATILEGAAQIGTVADDGKTFSVDASGTWVAQTVKAGTTGKQYKITIRITTSASSVFEADIILTVEAL